MGTITGDSIVKVDGDERYFQVKIDLGNSLSPLIDTSVDYANPGVWRKYRIPLRGDTYPAAVNSPSWSDMSMFRIIWSELDPSQLTREQQLVPYRTISSEAAASWVEESRLPNSAGEEAYDPWES